MWQHVFGHVRFGDLDSEFEQLAAYSRSAPPGIASTHHADQIMHLLRQGGSPMLPAPDFPNPIELRTLLEQGNTGKERGETVVRCSGRAGCKYADSSVVLAQ